MSRASDQYILSLTSHKHVSSRAAVEAVGSGPAEDLVVSTVAVDLTSELVPRRTSGSELPCWPEKHGGEPAGFA
jgi:hypothetical protein